MVGMWEMCVGVDDSMQGVKEAQVSGSGRIKVNRAWRLLEIAIMFIILRKSEKM